MENLLTADIVMYKAADFRMWKSQVEIYTLKCSSLFSEMKNQTIPIKK